MNILLSNDDGYQAAGLRQLMPMLEQYGKVTVVAPDRNRSGASNSLTLVHPIRAETMHDGVIRVDGTPTDCVHLAITGLLAEEPNIVVSGINSAPNMGDDVIYSGTVAAAMEGRFLGYPAIAVSMDSENPQYYNTGVQVVSDILKRILSAPLTKSTILNVNIPDIPYNQLKGTKITRLGHRHKAEPVIKSTDPRGKPIYWVGSAGKEADAGEGTDFHALRHHFVSITPIQVDLTQHSMLGTLKDWFKSS